MPAIVIPAPISSNHAAPVSAGGTGATTAEAARTNLDVYSKSEVTNAISQSTANLTKGVHQLWGTSISAGGFHQGIYLNGANVAYSIWFSGTSGIVVRSLRTGSYTNSSTSGTLQIGDDGDGTTHTLVRNGNTLTITVGPNCAMSLIYV